MASITPVSFHSSIPAQAGSLELAQDEDKEEEGRGSRGGPKDGSGAVGDEAILWALLFQRGKVALP